MTTVRRLRRGDSAHFTDMLDLFGEAFEEPETYRSNQPCPAYRDRLLERDDIVILAALHEEQVVGALVAYELAKFEQERSEFYVYDLAVDAGWRRQGIATSLFERLRHLARECGAWVIFVQADHGDDPAIALYDKLGKREEVLHFDISV